MAVEIKYVDDPPIESVAIPSMVSNRRLIASAIGSTMREDARGCVHLRCVGVNGSTLEDLIVHPQDAREFAELLFRVAEQAQGK